MRQAGLEHALKVREMVSGIFRTGSTASDNIEGVNTDAKSFTVSSDDNEHIQTIYFEGSSFTGKGLTISSTTSITCTLAFNEDIYGY